MLEGFLKNTTVQRHGGAKSGPWAALDRMFAANKKYLAASRLFDLGKKEEAGRALDELLKEEPQFPLAVMLKGLL
jgi:hypothetical protein